MHFHSYYREFSQEEFAADEYFQQWILSGDSSVDEFWQSHINLYPGQAATIEKAKLLVQELVANNYNHHPLTADEKAEIKQAIFQRLNIAQEEHFIRGTVRPKRYTWLAAASVILTVLAVSAFLLIKPEKKEAAIADMQVISSTEKKEVLLADSSVVVLNAGSSIKYKNDFLGQENREVFLVGNAFFKVKKQIDSKPFIVHTKALDVTVLGTQFNVDARTAATEISLTTGKVKISEAGNTEAAFILPGEKIKLDTADHVLIKSTFNTHLYSAWTENKWSFQETSLEEITNLVHQYYGIKTEFKKEKYKQVHVNAAIPVTTLNEFVTILSKTLHNIQVQYVNGSLIIQ